MKIKAQYKNIFGDKCSMYCLDLVPYSTYVWVNVNEMAFTITESHLSVLC